MSLVRKKITILGNGAIGKHLGNICRGLGMDVTNYTRNDNLLQTVSNADFIVNCLGVSTPSDFLDEKFFKSLKRGSFFISVTNPRIYNKESLFSALENGILLGIADDVASAQIGNSNDSVYRQYLNHHQIFVTPHIAWRTDYEAIRTYDDMISGIIKYLKSK